jgi:hypothetical protein
MPTHLLLELLTVTRMYRTYFNSIDIFVCNPDKQLLDFYITNIYNALLHKLSPKVDLLLEEIYTVLLDKEEK